MFTGIVEEIGKIISINGGEDFLHLTIEGEKVLKDVSLGDSIAVNGVCLTVTNFDKKTFTLDVMAETLRKSSLSTLKPLDLVNLESALTLNKQLGGHIVSGHIDGIGKISEIKKEGIATLVSIVCENEILKYIVSKGSVALDGVSLTIANVNSKGFTVSLIPHTKKVTVLSKKRKGDLLNIECDVIGKYVYKFLNKEDDVKSKQNLDYDFLNKHGFL